MLHVPAIHRFPGSNWGWHKLSEVLEAANNRFKARDVPVQTMVEFVKNFIAVDLSMYSLGEGPTLSTKMERGNGFVDVGVLRCSDLNLSPRHPLIAEMMSLFVPAGWSMKVFESIDNGVYRTEAIYIGETCTGRSRFLVVRYDHLRNKVV